jgi:O-6-methylguanine DNA methyltransferase
VTEGQGELGCGFLEVPQVHSRIWLAWTERGLARLHWSDAGADQRTAFGAELAEAGPVPEAYAEPLRSYFAGAPVDPVSLPVDLQASPFRLRVWQALRAIPRGQVRSYAGIAADVDSPRATRAVGSANGANPVAIVVPCHRVIETGMRLGGYSAGLERKRFLLELEGVKVVGYTVQPGQLALI